MPARRQRVIPPTPTADKHKRFGGRTFPIAYRVGIGKKASTFAMSVSVIPALLGCDRVNLGVTFVAVAIALISARPYAGSWNDGSRLATVESLVDYHTWAIDNSIFVRESAQPSPYPASEPALRALGTRDKIWIGNHFYSDKPPVAALFLAIVYGGLKLLTGLTAHAQPNWFCYLMTITSSGVAYVISVWAIDRLAARYELALRARLLVTVSFALGTIALPYSRHVNNHILLLAVCASVLLIVSRKKIFSTGELILTGSLAGAGYTLDFAIGSFLVIGMVGLMAAKTRAWQKVLVVLAAAFPWFALHHALNYLIAGTFLPANLNPAVSLWSGSPFTADLLTGGWHHRSVYHFASYAVDLLVGKRGFLLDNLPLLLVFPAAIWLLRQHERGAAEVWFAIAFSTFSWLIYAAASTNHGGVCCSVRWFVPLLAPGYLILVVFLHDRPHAEAELRILSAGGFVLGGLMWWRGPWNGHLVPGYWFIVSATGLAWVIYRVQRAIYHLEY